MKVRTRFAVSPTGFLHVGGVRTALFGWLTAQRAEGQFILRIEDTDKKREVAGAVQHIIDSLHWLGIDWDEGPDKKGMFGPYTQSERLGTYKEWAKKLIDEGRAYADPYTPEEVQAFREHAQKSKQPFLYRNHRPDNPPAWDGSQPLRFKSDPKPYHWHDEVMGDLSTGPEVIDDFILIKSDGFPTYNFAHIVDDAEMKITHIIRGQEFISSQPNYLNLYEAFGLEFPVFATMPHILKAEGNKKLGKRDGAKDILDYAKDGYLPEAMMSFLATLGWNDGTTKEIFTREELIRTFDLSRVQRSGARFDEHRLQWTNGHFIRHMKLEDLSAKVADFWPPEALSYDKDYLHSVLDLARERLKYFAELPELTGYFFKEPAPEMSLIHTHKQLKKLSLEERVSILKSVTEALKDIDFSESAIQTCLNQLLEKTGLKPVVLFSLIRIVVTWAPSSPGLSETLAVLGKERTLSRIQNAYDILSADIA